MISEESAHKPLFLEYANTLDPDTDTTMAAVEFEEVELEPRRTQDALEEVELEELPLHILERARKQTCLVITLRRCLPFLCRTVSDARITWMVRLGRISKTANRVFPAQHCALLKHKHEIINEEDTRLAAQVPQESSPVIQA